MKNWQKIVDSFSKAHTSSLMTKDHAEYIAKVINIMLTSAGLIDRVRAETGCPLFHSEGRDTVVHYCYKTKEQWISITNWVML